MIWQNKRLILINGVKLIYIIFFGKEAKGRRKLKKKNYSRRKKVPVASCLRRSRTPSEEEA
jgi:hypothetical protein